MKAHLTSFSFWLMSLWWMIGWTIVLFTMWFLIVFQPMIVVGSELIVRDDNVFRFTTHSYKPPLANTICGKPTLAVVIFEDPELLHVSQVRDNSAGYGSGDSRVRRWTTTGTIPNSLPKGVYIAVYKKIVYPCLGLRFEVKTPVHLFLNLAR